MTITNQPTGRKQKKTPTPASSRLPSARERRPALAALAVLLIAGGAVLAGWLALRQSQTASYLIVTTEVADSDQIEAKDLGRIELPKEAVPFILFEDASSVVDSYANAKLIKGTVLVPGMYGVRPELEKDQSRIGLELAPNQTPRGLSIGERVNVQLLDGSSDSNSTLLQTSGIVRYIGSADTGGGAAVDVVISSKCVSEFTSGSSNSNVTLAQVAPDAPILTCEP